MLLNMFFFFFFFFFFGGTFKSMMNLNKFRTLKTTYNVFEKIIAYSLSFPL